MMLQTILPDCRHSVFVAVADDGLVAIGSAPDPATELASLSRKAGCAVTIRHKLRSSAPVAEIARNAAHRLLVRHRLSGDWFDVAPDMAIKVADLVMANIEPETGRLSPGLMKLTDRVAKRRFEFRTDIQNISNTKSL